MSTLERAIAIAAEAHAGQVDKAGAPYILHPLRVMLSCAPMEDRIVAVLHDVVEDCPAFPLARLSVAGFSDEVVASLDALTRRKGESYDDFIERVKFNRLAVRVKLADLADNSDARRIGWAHMTPKDIQRMEKYRRATLALTV